MENAKYVALVLMLGCGLVHAEDIVRTVGDLDRLQSGRVFYDAQAAFNKSKMAAGQSDTITQSAAPSAAAGDAMPAASAASSLPALEKVAGTMATLELPDGSTTQVKPGDSVSGGFVVVSVSMRGVVMKRTQDGRQFTLN